MSAYFRVRVLMKSTWNLILLLAVQGAGCVARWQEPVTMAGSTKEPGSSVDPRQTLAFFGLAPDHRVLQFGSEAMRYTQVLAPMLARKGRLLVTSADASGTREEHATPADLHLRTWLEASPERYGKVRVVSIDPQHPALPKGTRVDLVLLSGGMEAMLYQGTLGGWLATFHEALVRRGVLGIEQARAQPDADPRDSASKGYLPEPWVVARVEAAGFELAESSELNADPEDDRDHPQGAAIGARDRMTLKFIKVEKAPPPSPFVP